MIETLYVYPSWAHAHDHVDYDVAMEIFSSPGSFHFQHWSAISCLVNISILFYAKSNTMLISLSNFQMHHSF